jgi:hypothetical protein
MTDTKVGRCTHPGCATLTTHWLCMAHSAPQYEVAPEHQPDPKNAACAVLAQRGPIADAITPGGVLRHSRRSTLETTGFPTHRLFPPF